MASAEFYRREAERCRAFAAATDDPDAAQRWLSMARDYDMLADALAKDAKAPASMQRQTVQQQQSKSEPQGKKSEPKDKP